MTEREKFEAWWLKDVPENHRDFAKKLLTEYGQDYAAAPGVADAWTVWKASRRAALEEIAKRFETEHGRTRDHNYWLVAASMVRALSSEQKK
ncbi:hypothetical protein P0D71_00330 [Paraburkholderia sp. RL17-383-BIF-A]|uniref:hypothetical protein n=1 Tax=Paraburkholderia sp. RL17-383-BIF-A TaxID=3031631 RepID=UPI0038BD4471